MYSSPFDNGPDSRGSMMPNPFSSMTAPSRRKSVSYTPEQDKSILDWFKRRSLGSLAALGNLLDVPGSMARDVLAGQNPVDQMIDPFGSSNRTSGRDLLRKYGMAGKKDTIGNWLGGVATEILTDPTNWITLGGKTALGQAAQKIGKLAPTLEEGVRTGQRALATFQVPLMPSQQLGHLGTGSLAANLGPKQITKYATKVSESTPARYVKQLLDSTKMGTITKEGQSFSPGAFDDLELARQKRMQKTLEYAQDIEKSGVHSSDEMANLRRLVEGVDPTLQDVSGVGGKMAAENAAAAARNRDFGFSDKVLKDDHIQYASRRALESLAMNSRGTQGVRNMNSPSMLNRLEMLKGFREGTEGINQLTRDQGIWNVVDVAVANPGVVSKKDAIKSIVNRIDTQFGGKIDRYYPRLDAKGNPLLDKAGNPLMRDRYKQLATWFLGNSDKKALRENGLFGNILADHHNYHLAGDQKEALATRLLPFIGKMSKDVAFPDKSKYMTIGEFLQEGSKGLIAAREDAQGIYGAVPKMMELMGLPRPADLKEAKAFAKRVIPRDVGMDLAQSWKSTTLPPELNKIADAGKRLTSLFKAGVLTHPARYVRDLFGATVRNLEEGMLSPQSLKEGVGVAMGSDPTSLLEHPLIKQYLSARGVANPTAKDAADAARILYASHAPGSSIYSEAGDMAAKSDPNIESILGQMPGRGYSGPGSVLKDIAGTMAGRRKDASWWPWKIAGFTGKDTQQPFFKAGELLGDVTDKAGRLPAFLELTRQGWTPAEAMKKINEAQVNYSSAAFTPTERQWLKSIFPFYSFQKQQLGHLARNLVESQGGSRLGNIIKGTSRQSSDDPYLPDHVKQASSIYLGQKPNEVQSYLTSLGLMHEDPGSLLGQMVTADARGLGLEAISNMNPLMKWLPEWSMGRTAFQQGPRGGRDLEDLDPTIGRIMSNIHDYATGERTRTPEPFVSRGLEFTLGNLPTSRWMTTLRTLTDPRKSVWEKALNTLTGVKISDVSPGMRDRVKTELVDALMSDMGARSFRNMYFNDQQEAEMSPEERVMANLLESIRSKIGQDQRARAAAQR